MKMVKLDTKASRRTFKSNEKLEKALKAKKASSWYMCDMIILRKFPVKCTFKKLLLRVKNLIDFYWMSLSELIKYQEFRFFYFIKIFATRFHNLIQFWLKFLLPPKSEELKYRKKCHSFVYQVELFYCEKVQVFR